MYSAPTQSEGGGLIQGSALPAIERFAKVENRSGNVSKEAGRQWNYDYKITVRSYPSDNYDSTGFVTFEGNRLSINSIEYENEGKKRFAILRCSRHE